MDDTYKNSEEYNPGKEYKIKILNIIVDLLSNKSNTIVTELFIRGKKLNISLVFTTHLHFAVLKYSRLNSAHYYENSKETRASTNCT